jgi:hypothetical protein
MEKVDPALVPHGGVNKVGGVKHYHSLVPEAQKCGIAIGKLRGHVNSAQYAQVDDTREAFLQLARKIVQKTGV